jgi:hypothetical protein
VKSRPILLLSLLAGCFHSEARLSDAGSGKPGEGSAGALLALAAPDPRRGDLLPEGWEPFQFEKIPRTTVYQVVLEDGAPALKARSESAASALRRKIAVDPAKSPALEWSWKVAHALGKADLTRKDGDDCAARVMILYRYDPAKASFLQRAKFESAKAMHGEYPPSAMLVYAWTGEQKGDEPVTSPYSDRVKVFPVERGASRAGTWVSERRNHLQDYRRAFGEEPPEIEAVAFMVDTDNTGSEATAWLRELKLLPR